MRLDMALLMRRKNMIKVAFDYYKNLFGYETRPKIRISSLMKRR
jgi:hypothetical protein